MKISFDLGGGNNKHSSEEKASEKWFDETVKISQHARDEISGVRSSYKWFLGLLTAFATVVFLIVTVVTNKSVNDFKVDLQTQASNRVERVLNSENIRQMVEQG